MENIDNAHEYDAIVVGLGVSGLMITYLLSKEGKSVLAFDKESHSGTIMTGSYGQTRGYSNAEKGWIESL